MKLLEDHINKLWASSKLSQAKRGITRLPCYVIYRVLDENRPLSGVLALEYFGPFFLVKQIYDGFGVDKRSLGIDLYFRCS